MLQARTIREGQETPESIGLPQTKEVGKRKSIIKKISYTTRRIAEALEARQRARYGTIAREDRSPEAADRMTSAAIEKHVRAWEKPSDHVPVIAHFDFAA